jgi:Tfp pilus assembly protein PilV
MKSHARAFSLLEVMIALGIFFMAIFTILALVSTSLRSARSLRRIEVDAGMVAAQLLIKTNRFTEGSESGDFGQLYADYSWEYDCNMVETNGLMQFDIKVFRRGSSQPVDAMSMLLFSPDSATLALGGPRLR